MVELRTEWGFRGEKRLEYPGVSAYRYRAYRHDEALKPRVASCWWFGLGALALCVGFRPRTVLLDVHIMEGQIGEMSHSGFYVACCNTVCENL